MMAGVPPRGTHASALDTFELAAIFSDSGPGADHRLRKTTTSPPPASGNTATGS
jgi:hypothetical protein